MEEGTRLHKWYQDKQGSEYFPEEYLSHTFLKGDYQIELAGRADGIIIHSEDNVTIDEIKTTNSPIDEFYETQGNWHLGQAKIYAFIYMFDHNLDIIKVQLTYISQIDNTDLKQYIFAYTKEDLQKDIDELLSQYIDFYEVIQRIKMERQNSIKNLTFPFDSTRPGQKEMMDFVSDSIQGGQINFCEAKTGIGKTVSALYPAIQALEKRNLEKIFYLTSKNSIKKVAFDTLKQLEDNKCQLKAVIMTSKEHICLNEKKRHCNPDECIYAKNYYDKINQVILSEIVKKNIFNFEDIVSIAKKYEVCPFELQLDLLNYVDVIVGDYNYLFDPRAKLIRFFENYAPNPYILLVDEGHNLPQRVRDMFSASIDYFEVLKLLKKYSKNKTKGIKVVKERLSAIADYFADVELDKSSSSWEAIKEEKCVPDKLIDLLQGFILKGKSFLKKSKENDDDFMNFYYEVNAFLNLPESDNRYAYYYTFHSQSKACMGFTISCLDSRYLIQSAYKAFVGGLVFSATLTPREYFLNVLGADKDSKSLYLPSPFKRENQLIMANPYISTKYNDRSDSIGHIAKDIREIVTKKTGNYFIFFPSFEYMSLIKDYIDEYSDIECFYQTSNMSEDERSIFLHRFQKNPSKTTLGFIVLGGIFSEGIDLVGDKLIGAIIVSVGHLRMSYLSDRLQNIIEKESPSKGYSYAYLYPGLNHVFQAAGRVIRGENDKGVILFIGKRYTYSVYKNNLYEMYDSIYKVNDQSIGKIVEEFWRSHENE
jgi:DNA excision repair protein ERCC-2